MAAREFTADCVQDLFFLLAENRNYKILRSEPVIPVHGSKRPLQGALNHFNQCFHGPAPWGQDYRGSAFWLHCINMSDRLDFGDPSQHRLMDILGNWFVGLNSKSDAINCAYGFLNGLCELTRSRIYIACYAGDTSLGLSADTESRNTWMSILPEKQLLNCKVDYYFGKDGCGPCGPCTMILFLPSRNHKYDVNSAITIDGQTYVELATIVSIESNREDGIFRPLVVSHTVSGINFEGLVTVLQHKKNFYDTDLFAPVFKAIHKCAGNGVQPYSGDVSVTCDVDVAYRVIADHIRIISCASAPQSQLGEQGRQYLLKCIDRRAIECGHQKLKIEAHYLELVKGAVLTMDRIYRGLHIKDRIEEIVKTEMLIYKKTLEEIEHELPKSAKKMKAKDNEGTEKFKRPVVWRKTRVVDFFGCCRHIVHKDKNEGCSLVSLCNVLLLGGKISLDSDTNEVSDHYLLHLVQTYLLCDNEKMKLNYDLERHDFQLEVLNVLPDFTGYLFMDMRFKSISDFVDSPQYVLFEYLSVPLYHGWLIDPQDKDLASAMSTQSFIEHSIEVAKYNSMKELGEKTKGDREELDDIDRAIMLSLGTSEISRENHVEIVTRFLRGSQLTPHGLESLRKELIEGEPGVLLWNDRFITLIMVGGALYLLVNDLNAANTRIVWELLNEVNQGGILMDEKFTAVDSNLNITMLPNKKDKKREKKKKNKDKERLLKLPSTSISGEKVEKIPEENQDIATFAVNAALLPSTSASEKKEEELPEEKEDTTFVLPSTSISEEIEEELFEENEDILASVEAGDIQGESSQPAVPCKRIYHMRMIDFFGVRTHIVYQDDNGPCTLVAICNVLLLKGVIKFEMDVREVPEDKLLSLLQGVLEESEKMKCEGLDFSVLQRQVRDVISILPHPVEMNMCFNRIDAFEMTPEFMVFDYLGINLFHGWISDDDVLHSAIHGHTYKSLTLVVNSPSFQSDLVEMALKFVNGPQLTNYGLRSLRRELEENVPFVLFWNGHFHTLIKFKGELYTLASDVGYLESAAAWITLMVNNTGLLVDDKFEPINLVSGITPMVPSISWEKDEDISEGNEDVSAFVLASMSGEKDKDIPEENEDDSNFVELATDHREIYFGQMRTPIGHIRYAPMSIVGGDYPTALKKGKINDARPRIFPAGDSVHTVVNTYSRRATPFSYDFEFSGFVSLGEFVHLPHHQFSEQRIIFPHSRSQIVADTRMIGRIIMTNALLHIIEAHQAKNSWNGKFDLSSIMVVNGYRVLITSPFCEHFSEEAMVADFIAILEIVFPLFNVEGVGMPAYFSQLENSLRAFRPHSMQYHQLSRFWDFIRNHLALKSSMYRTNLFTGLTRVRHQMPRHLRNVLRSVLMSRTLKYDWRQSIVKGGDPLLKKVLRYSKDENDRSNPSRNRNDGGKDPKKTNSAFGHYHNTLFSALSFPRHVNEHGTDLIEEVDGEKPVEEVIDLPSDLDLLCSHHMATSLSMIVEDLYCSDKMTANLWLMLEELFDVYSLPEAS